ncbi:MAG: hypothetical protein JKY53_10700 [Flavobacteriales bacterium]|nr:hypothetical protein [Flavobacteriales bacterium]
MQSTHKHRTLTFLTSALLLLTISDGLAQGFNAYRIDPRIVEAFGEDYVIKMQREAPHRLQYLLFFLDSSYYIRDLPSGKEYTDILSLTNKNGTIRNLTIDLTDLASFNVLLFDIPRSQRSRMFYKIGNTGKVIVFYSGKEFIKKFNEKYP